MATIGAVQRIDIKQPRCNERIDMMLLHVLDTTRPRSEARHHLQGYPMRYLHACWTHRPTIGAARRSRALPAGCLPGHAMRSASRARLLRPRRDSGAVERPQQAAALDTQGAPLRARLLKSRFRRDSCAVERFRQAAALDMQGAALPGCFRPCSEHARGDIRRRA